MRPTKMAARSRGDSITEIGPYNGNKPSALEAFCWSVTVPESSLPGGAARTSSEGLRRLWAEIRPHPIDAGAVGDYVTLQIRAGPDVAARAFPEVAAHGVDECPTCREIARDVRAFLSTSAALAAREPGSAQQRVQASLAASLIAFGLAGKRGQTRPWPGEFFTFLLTDVEDSTALWERDGAA